MATVCKRVLYRGRVQGVGFRYTVQGVAAGRPVVGFVRNLPTGEVELVAEGDAAAVDGFLNAVAQRMAGYIAAAQSSDAPPTGRTDFRILG
jgi:acylphosphatase